MIIGRRRLGAAWFLAFAAAIFAIPSSAQSIVGQAKALDGDSLEVGGKQVRLFGIDAPELDQTCQKAGSAWTCGQAAKEQLASIVAGRQVQCQGQGVDHFARILAVCSVGYDEINRVMVEQGWAVAFRQFSDAYLAAELQAKTHGLGIWSSAFVSPSDYRQSQLPAAQVSSESPRRSARAGSPSPAGTGCTIKGNHSRKGEWIYHLPGMPYYAQTRAEAMFCSEAEAIASGYRKSRAGN